MRYEIKNSDILFSFRKGGTSSKKVNRKKTLGRLKMRGDSVACDRFQDLSIPWNFHFPARCWMTPMGPIAITSLIVDQKLTHNTRAFQSNFVNANDTGDGDNAAARGLIAH
jgi:hypothetical protein